MGRRAACSAPHAETEFSQLARGNRVDQTLFSKERMLKLELKD